jgi:hypothetical protein
MVAPPAGGTDRSSHARASAAKASSVCEKAKSIASSYQTNVWQCQPPWSRSRRATGARQFQKRETGGFIHSRRSRTIRRSEYAVVDERVRNGLRWVKASGNEDLDRFPDFLILGPQRTGTTWLHAHLRYHPQIFLTEPKELYFFSCIKTRDPKRFVSDELAWYLRFFHDPLWRVALKTGICLWQHRERYRPIVRGEATASYAALDPDVIADITLLNPDIKAILMIRNPIERAWSHAKKDIVRERNRRVADVSAEEFRAFFSDQYQRRCAAYVDQHEAWSARLRPGNLLVGRFDDIATRPEELLLEVMRFLGVRSERRYIARGVRNPVNPTEAARIPEQHRRFLEELLRDDLRKLNDRFGLSW